MSSRSPACGALHALCSWAVGEQNARPWTHQHLRHGSRPRRRTRRRERLRALPRSTKPRHRVGFAPHPEGVTMLTTGTGTGTATARPGGGGGPKPLSEKSSRAASGRGRRPRRRRPRPRAPPRIKVTLDPSTKFAGRTQAPKRTGLGAELAPGTSLRRAPRRPARVWGRKAARRPR